MIREGKSYGVFSSEADPLIALVQEHQPVEEIEGFACPRCASSIRVGFYPNGKGFVISCGGTPAHITQYQEITHPPSWWWTRIIDVVSYLES